MPKLFHVASLYGPVALTADAGSGIDTSVVSDILSVITQTVGALFTMFPLNVFIVIGIISAGIGLFAKSKSAVKH